MHSDQFHFKFFIQNYTNRYSLSHVASFPAVVMELSNHEIKEWFGPADFGIGKHVLIYNRPFLIYDCDEFTKSYLNAKYNVRDFTPVAVSGPASRLPKMVSEMSYDIPWELCNMLKKICDRTSQHWYRQQASLTPHAPSAAFLQINIFVNLSFIDLSGCLQKSPP